ncbi:MAG: hypothetical protein KIT83_02875 [Bryobacterales bacterium]|nr:hypothetical protein [Bryobacterales bacterium]
MWKGCVFFLVLFGACFVVEWVLLPQAAEPYRWQFSIALAFLVTLVVSQLWSLWHSLGRWRLSHKDQAAWQNGDLVAASGPLQPLRLSLKAPVSGRDVVIYEFQVLRPSENRKSEDSERIEVVSYGMAPCGVYTNTGMLRLTGFPILIYFPKTTFAAKDELKQAARHIAANRWTRKGGSIRESIQQLMSLYSAADASTEQHFVNPHSVLPVTIAEQDGALSQRRGEPDSPELTDRIHRLLRQQRATAQEIVIEAGTTVTVFGMYRADIRAIDVATALFNVNRALYPGSLNQVVGRLVRNAALGPLVVSALAASAHHFAFVDDGVWLRKLAGFVGE